MMDDELAENLRTIGQIQQFEQWLEHHDHALRLLGKLSIGQWEELDISLAQAALSTYRVVLNYRRARLEQLESERS